MIPECCIWECFPRVLSEIFSRRIISKGIAYELFLWIIAWKLFLEVIPESFIWEFYLRVLSESYYLRVIIWELLSESYYLRVLSNRFSSKFYPRHFLKCSDTTGATIVICSFFTGWTNWIVRECRQILPSGFERGAPYFKSPFITHPIVESWHRIWWCLPVYNITSNK